MDVLQIEIFRYQARADARRFKYYRQATAGMGAAAHQIDAGQIFEPIVRPHVEHLRQVVRQVERGALKNAQLVSPASRRQHLLHPNTTLQIGHTELAQTIERLDAEASLLDIPV